MSLTPYAAIKQLNVELAKLNEPPRPTQMGYSYASKGYINGVKGTKSFTQDEVDRWIVRFLTKNGFIEAVNDDTDKNQLVLDI